MGRLLHVVHDEEEVALFVQETGILIMGHTAVYSHHFFAGP
jgi:hypothetical protein